jgi:hypothetical protein
MTFGSADLSMWGKLASSVIVAHTETRWDLLGVIPSTKGVTYIASRESGRMLPTINWIELRLKHFPGGLNLTPGGNVAHQPFKIPLPPKPKPAKLRVLDPLVKEQRRTRILAIAAESRKNPKVIDKIRESMIRVNADTNMRELRQKASLKAFQDESVKSKHLAALRAYWDKRNLAA